MWSNQRWLQFISRRVNLISRCSNYPLRFDVSKVFYTLSRCLRWFSFEIIRINRHCIMKLFTSKVSQFIYILAFQRANYIGKIRVFIRWNNARSGPLLRSSTTTSKRAWLYYIETMCFCSCTCEFSGAYQFPSRSKCRHRRHVRHERARIAWESKTEKKKERE